MNRSRRTRSYDIKSILRLSTTGLSRDKIDEYRKNRIDTETAYLGQTKYDTYGNICEDSYTRELNWWSGIGVITDIDYENALVYANTVFPYNYLVIPIFNDDGSIKNFYTIRD